MDYRFARAFLATAESKSFSKAAMELRIAQSAISRQIKLLEESVGFQLFFRSNKEVSLTERGELLFSRLKDFHKWVEHQYQDEPTEISIAALDGIMDSYVIPKISQMTLSSKLKLKLSALKHADIETSIARGEIDIAITYLPIRANGYACRKLFEQSMVMISSRPLKNLDVSNARWIHMGRAEFLRKNYSQSNQADIVANSLSNIIKLVSAGLGIAIVPESVVSDIRELHKRPLSDTSKIYLIARDFAIMPEEFKRVLVAMKK